MPTRPPAPKHGPAIPLGGAPLLVPPAAPRVQRTPDRQPSAMGGGSDFFFYAFMVLTALGVLAMCYALLTL